MAPRRKTVARHGQTVWKDAGGAELARLETGATSSGVTSVRIALLPPNPWVAQWQSTRPIIARSQVRPLFQGPIDVPLAQSAEYRSPNPVAAVRLRHGMPFFLVVAQSGRALAYEARARTFDPCRRGQFRKVGRVVKAAVCYTVAQQWACEFESHTFRQCHIASLTQRPECPPV